MASPIISQEVVNLVNLGIQPSSITFLNVSMESEKYICVRDNAAQNTLVTIDLSNPSNPQRRPMTADSAIMNPIQNTIALKAKVPGQPGDSIQVFNLDVKQKLKAYQMPEPIKFWKWITATKIGIVTDDAVFHWDLNGPDQPTKIFDRTMNMQQSQIINYRVDPNEKWCVLVAIQSGSPERPQLVKGHMQLYSVEQNKSQQLEAHAAAFGSFRPQGSSPITVIAFATKTLKEGQLVSKLHIIEVKSSGSGSTGAPFKKQSEMFFPQEFEDDFPVSIQISSKYGLIYIFTKQGLLFVYDLETATAIVRNRISQDAVFIGQEAPSTGGAYVINRRGSVILSTVNEQTMVPFIAQQLQNLDVALSLARIGNLPGAENLILQQFEKLFSLGQVNEAAELAAEAPQGILRNKQTLDRLKMYAPQPGQKSPLLLYFGNLLNKGTLNQLESLELGRLVLSQNKKELLTTWWGENKLTGSEELGDILQQAGDSDLALKVYQACNAKQKVVVALAGKGDMGALVTYTGNQGYTPDYLYLMQNLLMTNPSGAVALAKNIAKVQPKPPVDINTLSDLFLQRNMVREATAFLLDVLQVNLPEHSQLQNKVLEINLITNPQVADAILANKNLTHYDKAKVAQLCEKAGLYLRALEHYSELSDIKRCIVHTQKIDQAQLTEFFGTLPQDWALACLKELLSSNMSLNLNLVINIARDYSEQIGVDKIISLLESFNSQQGLFLYLGGLVSQSEDENVHFKYIQAATKIQQIKEVERMTRESSHYPPEKVKNFLIEAKLPDCRPLINVCDRFDMVQDLTAYLYQNNMLRYVEGYVQRVNPQKTPEVVGALLDQEAPEEFITTLITSVRSLIPVGTLCEEVEKRNRLRLLAPFINQLVQEGSQDAFVHSALGKITIDQDNNAEQFLTTNPYYDSLSVGKYCEKRDPSLACVAYKRGLCDDALLSCSNRNSLFKLQARYITERMDLPLWAKVLDPSNKHRRSVIDQVTSTSLPESNNPEQVSTAVKAFMAADLQAELIELLEKVVLQNSAFKNNPNLQNLLVITAIKSQQSKVKDYVSRLDKFNGPAVGEIAIQYQQYEEAFLIYKKFDLKVEAISVLLDYLKDFTRAYEFAIKVDEVDVWSRLANAQLINDMVEESIESFLKAQDGSQYETVIEKTKELGKYDDLIKYLLMVRTKVKEQKVDSELVYAYTKNNQLQDLETFLQSTHLANLQISGDRCYEEKHYEAAKTIYSAIPNYGRLASTLVQLGKFPEAIDAAKKANSPKTWKEICYACVDLKEFKLAHNCGLNIIVNADDLEEMSVYYQKRGYFVELIDLLEHGVGLERAHVGIFTELGILYSRYKPEKLMEHIKLFSARINVPRLIRSCEELYHWKELVFLYTLYDEYDNAAMVMINHSPEAWENVLFKDVSVKISSNEVQYRGLQFYLEQHPDLINDLLRVLEARLDAGRVVQIFRDANALSLIRDYLMSAQKGNLGIVNEAVNELLYEEEDFEALRTSIVSYDAFDQLDMAAKLEKSELMEFRRIAAYIYKRNLRWRKAIELSKQDSLYKDAMETTSQSGDPELSEDLLRYFIEKGQKECFAACLYICYDSIKADVVLELAWLNGLMEYIMPYLIQFIKEYTGKVDLLINEREQALKAQKGDTEKSKLDQDAQNAMAPMLPLGLPAPPTGGAMYGDGGGSYPTVDFGQESGTGGMNFGGNSGQYGGTFGGMGGGGMGIGGNYPGV